MDFWCWGLINRETESAYVNVRLFCYDSVSVKITSHVKAPLQMKL